MDLLFRVNVAIKFFTTAKSNLYLHAPFLFDFSEKVLRDKTEYPEYRKMKNLFSAIADIDLSININAAARKIKSELISSSVNEKYGKLIFRICKYYHCKNIIDLGTNLGISAAWMALSNHKSHVLTFEKNTELISIAASFHKRFSIQNIHYVKGDIDHTLQTHLNENDKIDFVLMDANHTHIATKTYFEILAPHLHANSIVIIDDINWSKEMNHTWQEINQHPSVTLSINLYRMGILFFNPDLSKENFTLFF